MSGKYLIILLAIILAVCVGLSPTFAGDDTYSIDVEGIDFNMPNGYHLKEDFIFEDETTTPDRLGNNIPIHYKSVSYTDGKNSIEITVSTSQGKPFELEDVLDGGSKTTIANKTGSITKSPNDVAFWYVEDGKMVMIETLMDNNNEKIIEKVIGG